MNETITPLFKEEEIAAKVSQLADKINADYKGKQISVLAILKGSVFFLSDLLRRINLPVTINFVELRSYKGTESMGEVKIRFESDFSMEQKNVLIVEDIVDTGITLDYLIKRIELHKPSSIKICTLIEKPSRKKIDIKSDYLGFTIADYYIVGYGLDYNEHYRNLPFIGILHK